LHVLEAIRFVFTDAREIVGALGNSNTGGTWVDASGNLSWPLKKPEERPLADFVSVRPDPIEAAWSGGAPEASTLHR
jgi:hypothetical protein